MHSTIRRTGRAALLLAGALAASTSIAAEPEILYLSEGRVYRGELANGVPHGEGRMIWPSGAMYVAGPGSTEHATATASTATAARTSASTATASARGAVSTGKHQNPWGQTARSSSV